MPDTHCWLWWGLEPERFGPNTLDLLASSEHALYLSAASAWEIAVKYSRGKLKLATTPAEYLRAGLLRAGAAVLDISLRHALTAGALPDVHRDPFDRILIAQAQCEQMTLVSADPTIRMYNVLAHDATS